MRSIGREQKESFGSLRLRPSRSLSGCKTVDEEDATAYGVCGGDWSPKTCLIDGS